MGKRKQISTVQEERFAKRRNTLYKKAEELSILCGSDIAVIVISSTTGEVSSYGSPHPSAVIDRYVAMRNLQKNASSDSGQVFMTTKEGDEKKTCGFVPSSWVSSSSNGLIDPEFLNQERGGAPPFEPMPTPRSGYGFHASLSFDVIGPSFTTVEEGLDELDGSSSIPVSCHGVEGAALSFIAEDFSDELDRSDLISPSSHGVEPSFTVEEIFDELDRSGPISPPSQGVEPSFTFEELFDELDGFSPISPPCPGVVWNQ